MRLSDLALNLLDLLDAELAMSHKRRVFWARGEFSKARYIENNVLPHFKKKTLQCAQNVLKILNQSGEKHGKQKVKTG